MTLRPHRRELSHHHATEIDHQMMMRAIELAREAWDMEEVPVGAVVYIEDEIIAEAHNLCESDRDATAHAEMIAMRAAAQKLDGWRLNQCSMAVTLEPCPMCAGALVNARMGRLIYGATDPKKGAVQSLYEICNDERLNHNVEVIGGVYAPQCRGILRDFFKQRRKINRERRNNPNNFRLSA